MPGNQTTAGIKSNKKHKKKNKKAESKRANHSLANQMKSTFKARVSAQAHHFQMPRKICSLFIDDHRKFVLKFAQEVDKTIKS